MNTRRPHIRGPREFEFNAALLNFNAERTSREYFATGLRWRLSASKMCLSNRKRFSSQKASDFCLADDFFKVTQRVAIVPS